MNVHCTVIKIATTNVVIYYLIPTSKPPGGHRYEYDCRSYSVTQ